MKKYFAFLLLPAFALLQFCSSGKKAAAIPKTTFDDVIPLVSLKCAPCHTTGNKSHIGEYSIAKERADSIIYRIQLNPDQKGFMPFKHEKLSDSAINVFVKWKNDGLLEKTATEAK